MHCVSTSRLPKCTDFSVVNRRGGQGQWVTSSNSFRTCYNAVYLFFCCRNALIESISHKTCTGTGFGAKNRSLHPLLRSYPRRMVQFGRREVETQCIDRIDSASTGLQDITLTKLYFAFQQCIDCMNRHGSAIQGGGSKVSEHPVVFWIAHNGSLGL